MNQTFWTPDVVLGVVGVLCLIVAGTYWILAGSAELGLETAKEDKFNIMARIFLGFAAIAFIMIFCRLVVFKM